MSSVAFVIQNERGFRALAGVTCTVEGVPGKCVEVTHGCVYTKVLAEAIEHAEMTESDFVYVKPVTLDEDADHDVDVFLITLDKIMGAQ